MRKAEVIPSWPAVCPVCSSENMDGLISLHDVPVACHILQPSAQQAVEVPRGNIELAVCQECGHIFNLDFDSTLIDYQSGYENALHFSPYFKDYLEKVVERLITTYNLNDNTILDVGSGDGYFLELICERSNSRGIGFDPGNKSVPGSNNDGRVQLIADTYSEKYVHPPVDLLLSRHVLEHVQDPRAFLDNMKRAIEGREDAVMHLRSPKCAVQSRTRCHLGFYL